jgi:hypothetical protein
MADARPLVDTYSLYIDGRLRRSTLSSRALQQLFEGSLETVGQVR